MSISVDIKKHFPFFSLEVAFSAEDETFGFLGASGCGKSLTLRCIAGLETPDEGRIVVNGKVFFDSAKKINLKPQLRKTALLFQDYKLFPNLTVAENIAAGFPRTMNKTEKHDRISAQLKRFNLKGYGSRYPARLSGGQQQRVALARMLAAEPGILMLDEPFSSLDTHLKNVLEDDMITLFEQFKGTVLYISHDIDEAFRFCNRIGVFEEGRIVETASAEDLITAPKSLAGIKVTGVRNICRAQKIDVNTVKAIDWDLPLSTAQKVEDDIAWAAVRASFLRLASPADTENVFDFTVRLTIDTPFERTAILDPGGLRWSIDKFAQGSKELPTKGQAVRMHIPPEKIYLVKK